MENKKNTREIGADAFDELFANQKKQSSDSNPPKEDNGAEHKKFVDAMYEHVGKDGDVEKNFERFYEEHRDKFPERARKLGRDGLRVRYKEAYEDYRRLNGDKAKIEEHKKRFSF